MGIVVTKGGAGLAVMEVEFAVTVKVAFLVALETDDDVELDILVVDRPDRVVGTK